MAENAFIVGTYPPTKCGIATFDANLATFVGKLTSETNSLMVAPIDEDGYSFSSPVNPDLIIDKWNPNSWLGATCQIGKIVTVEKTGPSYVLLSHEFGLDPDPSLGADEGRCKGNNYVNMSEILKTISNKMPKHKRLLVFPLLHTVPPKPNPHQRKTIQNLAKNSDSLIVMTEVARNFLTNVYGVESPIDYVHHGVRVHDITEDNQKSKKELYKVEDRFNVISTGRLSPAKDLVGVIEGFSSAKKQLPENISNKMLLSIIGGFHPGFVSAEGGKHYDWYINQINKTLKKNKLSFFRDEDLDDFIKREKKDLDVAICEAHIPEERIGEPYAIADVAVANHTDLGQMHSGTVPEAMGASLPQITTKFYNSLEMLADIKTTEECPYKGKVIGIDVHKGQTAGLIIDPYSPEQLGKAIAYLASNPKEKEVMKRTASSRAIMMKWQDTAQKLVRYVQTIRSRDA